MGSVCIAPPSVTPNEVSRNAKTDSRAGSSCSPRVGLQSIFRSASLPAPHPPALPRAPGSAACVASPALGSFSVRSHLRTRFQLQSQCSWGPFPLQPHMALKVGDFYTWVLSVAASTLHTHPYPRPLARTRAPGSAVPVTPRPWRPQK